MSVNIGDQIRQARTNQGWTQGELARRAGATLRTVGNWERSSAVPAAKLQLLEQLLGVSLDGRTDTERLLARALGVNALDHRIDADRVVYEIQAANADFGANLVRMMKGVREQPVQVPLLSRLKHMRSQLDDIIAGLEDEAS